MTLTVNRSSAFTQTAQQLRWLVVGALALGLIIASSIWVAPAAHAATGSVTVNGVKYQINESSPADGATAVSYSAAFGADAVIEPEVEIDTVMYPVTAIGNYAFSHQALESVTIPNSVISIGSSAFYQNALTHLEVGDSVETIGAEAFYENDLEQVTLPTP